VNYSPAISLVVLAKDYKINRLKNLDLPMLFNIALSLDKKAI